MNRGGILHFLVMISVVMIRSGWGQSPPGWVVQSNLPDGIVIRDIAIPTWNQTVVLACGQDRFGRAAIWRSGDAGNSWMLVKAIGNSNDHFRKIDFDPQNFRIWVGGDLASGNLDDGLYYSLDEGNTWTAVNYPNALDSVGTLVDVAVSDGKVYYGGFNDAVSQIHFYRYNTTNPNPANWNWEKIDTFSDAKGITHFLKTGQFLYIFVRHSVDNASSIYRLNLVNDQLSFLSNINLTWVGGALKKNGIFYVAGNYDGIARVFKSSDGIVWTKIGEWSNSTANYLHAFTIEFFQDTLFVGLGGYSDENYMIYRTADDGSTWQGCFTPDGAGQVYSLKNLNNDLWCGTGFSYGDVFKATWNVETGGVYVFGPTWVYSARAHNGAVYFTTNYDFGEVYKMPDDSTANIFKSFSDAGVAYDVNWLNDTIFVAIDGANKIKKSSDNGQNWVDTFMPDGVTNVLTIFNKNNSEMLIGTEPFGDVFRSNNQYQTGGVYVFGPTWVFQAKHHNGAIYFTTDYDFGEIYKMPDENSVTLWKTFTDADDAYDIEWYEDTIMVSLNSANLIKRSSDGGSTWEDTFKPDGATHVYSIKYFPNTGLFVGTDPFGDVFKANNHFDTGGIYLFGPTWVYQAKEHNGEIYFTTNYDFGEIYKMPNESSASIWKTFNDASLAYDLAWMNDTLIVSIDGGNLIKRSSDGGTTWENTFKPDGANAVLILKKLSNSKMIIGTDPYGDVFLSNYRFQTGGTIINGPSWVYDAQFCGNTGFIATNFGDGEIWKTEDGGQTWQNLTGFSQPWNQVYSIVAFGHTLYAGTDYNGDVYVSQDDGLSWQATGDLAGASDVFTLHLSTQSQRNRLFAGTGPNGNVFLTDTTVMTLQAPPIVQEPEFTEGTENTIFCYNNGLDGYQFQVAYDSLFQAVVQVSPVLQDTFYTFQNLQDGIKYYYRVFGKSCQFLSLPSGYTFSIQDALPPTFLSEQPQDSVWVADTRPLIQVKYKDTASGIQVSTVVLQIDGTTILAPQVSDTLVSYLPTSDLSPGMHAVNVSLQDKVGHNASFTWHFGIDNEPPQNVTLIDPVDGIFINHPQVTFTWKSGTDILSGISHYELVYSTDSTFQNNVHTVSVNDTSYSVTLVDTIYFWKIRAFDRAGNVSESKFRHFEVDTRAPGVPQLLYPMANSWLSNTQVIFQWEPVNKFKSAMNFEGGSRSINQLLQQRDVVFEDNRAAPVHYIIQVFNSHGSVLLDTVTTNQYNATLPEGQYFWKIKAFDDAGNSSTWSDSSQFGIDVTRPGAVQLVSPSSGAIFSTQTIAFRWRSANDNLSGIQNYVLYIDDNSSFTSPDSIVSADTSVIYSPGFDSTFYWKVRAYDKAGLSSDWSPVYDFIIDSHPPAIPQLIYPISGQWIDTTTVNFQWGAVNSVVNRIPQKARALNATFEKKVSRTLAFTHLSTQKNLNTPVHYIIEVKSSDAIVVYDSVSTTHYSALLSEGTYQWRVKAYDEAGNESGWTNYESFGIDRQPPQVISCQIIPDTVSIDTIQIVITLKDSGAGLSANAPPNVHFRPSNGALFSVTQTSYDTSTGEWKGKAYIPQGTNEGIATLYISAAADLLGNVMTTNSNYWFLIDQTPPARFSLVEPDSGIWLNDRKPLFIWRQSNDALSGLSHFDLYLNDTVRVSGIAPSDTSIFPASPLPDGRYDWKVVASDFAGNSISTSTWTVKIDSTPPVVSISYPQNGDSLPVGLVTIKGTAQDVSGNFNGIGVDTVYVSTDGGSTWLGAASDSANFSRWSFQWMVPHKGTYVIKAFGSDQLGTSGTPGLGITVVVSNSSPVVVSPIPDTTFLEDTDSLQLVQNLNHVFSDLDGDTLTFTLNPLDSNLVVWLVGDTAVWVAPAPDFFGQTGVVVFASDGDGGLAADTIQISVLPVNDPPVIVNLPDSVVFPMDSSAMLDMSIYAFDVDTPDSLLRWVFLPSNDSLQVNYNDTTKMLILSAPDFVGQVILYCRLLDDSMAYDEDSLLVHVTFPVGIDQLADLGVPKTYVLDQNFPNPFNPTTVIRYGVPKTTHVRIEVYNIVGQRVAVLVNERKYPGFYFVQMDAQNLASGMYFYRLKTDEFEKVRKMLLVK
ncbi:MAG: T9SS C-terminal target domain-containing protein [Calditrichaeota bacterium]|nr:MAG: T9SS C-terminal target domain-containing protein [Calditrichota bacterium]